jgi:hypothetical protein
LGSLADNRRAMAPPFQNTRRWHSKVFLIISKIKKTSAPVMCTPIPEEEKRREERKKNVERKGGGSIFVKSFKGRGCLQS